MVFRRTAVGVATLLIVAGSCGIAQGIVITFDEMDAGSLFQPGDVFSSSSVAVRVDASVLPLGSTLYPVGGSSVSVAAGMAGGGGNELQMTNAAVTFDFPQPAFGICLQFRQQARGINLQIGNDLIVADSLSAMNGWVLGDTQVFVPFTSAEGLGALIVVGAVESLSIGGTSLAIDNVIGSYVVPEPATLALLGSSGLMLLKRRQVGP